MMVVKVVDGPTLEDWTAGIHCTKCETVFEFDGRDLAKDEFKTDGFWFAGTATTREKVFIHCPNCRSLYTWTKTQMPLWLWIGVQYDY